MSMGRLILEGLPTDDEVIQRVPSLIGPLRETNFGKTFTVESKQDATSNAYTTMTLPVHTDLCTREYEPGLQFLHCIRNEADGGENILADGFRLAEQIKADAPEEYAALTTVPITFYNKATDTDFRCTVPMFDLDKNGDLSDVRWSPWLRAPVRASFEETEWLYRGLRRAFTLAEDPAFTVRTKLKAGDLLCFDNRRALHGRVGYDPTTGGRKLMGCYVEREDLVSALRDHAAAAGALRRSRHMVSVPATMAGVHLTGQGGLEKLVFREDIPTPKPGQGDVLIQVTAADMNNTDINTRIGWYSSDVKSGTTAEGALEGLGDSDTDTSSWTGGLTFPRIQGADCVGRIVAVGDGVSESRIGERVVCAPYIIDPDDETGLESAGFLGSEYDGAFAQFVSVPSRNVFKVTEGVDLSDAALATLPCSGGTATNMLVMAGAKAWI